MDDQIPSDIPDPELPQILEQKPVGPRSRFEDPEVPGKGTPKSDLFGQRTHQLIIITSNRSRHSVCV